MQSARSGEGGVEWVLMRLTPVPAFDDNYIWVLHDDAQRAIVVDPGDAAPIQQFLVGRQLRPVAVFITHHHRDHTGGLPTLREVYPKLRVYAPDDQRISDATDTVQPGDTLRVLDTDWQVLDLSGHTLSHIGYHAAALPTSAQPLLFSGDCLFKAGCGRLFEGTASQLFDSLQRIAALPDATRIACTHEYTLANMRFALHADGGNHALIAEQTRCAALREKGLPTLPSTLAMEKATNPFLRAQSVAELADLRQRKDNF